MGRTEFAPQVSGSGEGAMPPAGSRPPLPDSGSGNRTRELGSGISDPRSARPSMGRNEFAPQDSSVSSRRRLTNPLS